MKQTILNFRPENGALSNDNPKSSYGAGNEVIYNTELLKSLWLQHNDAYILVRSDICSKGHQISEVTFKNCSPFTKFIVDVNWWNNSRRCGKFRFSLVSA